MTMSRKSQTMRVFAVIAVAAVCASCGTIGDGAGSSSAEETAAATSNSAGGGKKGYDRHPSGVTFRVHEVKVRDQSVAVSFTAFNGQNEAVTLNNYGVTLLDDKSNVYKMKAPEQNSKLAFRSGEKMTGTLVFPGEWDKHASTVEFRTNANVDKIRKEFIAEDRSTSSTNPMMRIADLKVTR